MSTKELIAYLTAHLERYGDLPVEIFSDSQDSRSFRPLIEVAPSGEFVESLILSTVPAEFFDRPIGDAGDPKTFDQVLRDAVKTAEFSSPKRERPPFL